MCDPTGVSEMMIASMAISAAATTSEYVGQQQQASAQKKANNTYAMSESDAIRQNAEAQYGQAQNQIQYTDAQARQKQIAENMQASSAMGVAQTNASARGVSGNSVDAIQRDYTNRAAMFNADVEFNRKASDQEIIAQMQGIQRGAQSQSNNVSSQARAPQGPSPLSLVAGYASDAANAYGLSIKNKPPAPTTTPSGPTSADYAAYDSMNAGPDSPSYFQ